MKVAIIGTVGIPANYGGFETLVENLVTHKKNEDIQYTVYCTTKAYTTKQKYYKGARLKYVPFNANGWQALIYDNLSLLRAYLTSDVILCLGGNDVILPLLKLFKKKRVINNFDGMDCSREKWGGFTRKTILFTTKITAKHVDTCVADNEIIKNYLKDKYNRDSEVIEYGGDTAYQFFDGRSLENDFGLTKGNYFFKVARIEPENNLEMILNAFTKLPRQNLVIVGNWNKSAFGRALRQKFRDYDNIRLLDPIYDPQILNNLRSNCKVYLHGHSSGGTNPSLVEAMSLGLPIISFDVDYNRATTEDKAVYFADVDSLVQIIENIENVDLTAAGDEMKEIADRRYTWSTICEKYEKLYF